MRRFSARKICDVTSVTAEDLLSPVPPLKLVGEELQSGQPRPAKCRVICVASGKGGTGKSIITSNFATLLAKEGLRVLLLDADLGLANAHLLLGATPLHDISSVVSGEKGMRDIMIECACGLKLICGGSGFSDMADMGDGTVRNLAFELKDLEEEFDIIMVDLSAGISPQVVRFLSAAHDMMIVTNPDPSALLDAYATIKVMVKTCGGVKAKIIVNKAREREDAVEAFKKLEDVSARRLLRGAHYTSQIATPMSRDKEDEREIARRSQSYVEQFSAKSDEVAGHWRQQDARYNVLPLVNGAELSFFGWLPQNFYIQDSVSRREPVVLCHPKSFVTANLRTMAGRIMAEHEDWVKSLNGGAEPNETRPVSFAWKLGRMVF